MNLIENEQWRDAAALLLVDGWSMYGTEGIVPAVFVKEGHDDVYLYIPTRDENGHILKNKDRQWMPRPVRDKPVIYSVQDIAEHLGISPATVKHALYRAKTLKPDRQLGSMLAFDEHTVTEWNKRRGRRGKPPSDQPITYDRLYLTNKDQLLSLIRRRIENGQMNANLLINAILAENLDLNQDIDRETLSFMAKYRLDNLLDIAGKLERGELIKVILRSTGKEKTD